MIVSLHVATGAAAGAAGRSRLAAVFLGPVLHIAGDRVPHQDIRSRRFEVCSGVAGILLLAARRGPLDPATLGAAASSAPDLEHVLPFLRPRGRKLFHGRRGWHRAGRFSATQQLLLACVILGALIAPRTSRLREPADSESMRRGHAQGERRGGSHRRAGLRLVVPSGRIASLDR